MGRAFRYLARALLAVFGVVSMALVTFLSSLRLAIPGGASMPLDYDELRRPGREFAEAYERSRLSPGHSSRPGPAGALDWHGAPDLSQQQMESLVRRDIVRTASVATPILVVLLAAFAYFVLVPLARGELRLFLLLVLGALTVLSASQAIPALRDLRGGVRTVRGTVTGTWRARDWQAFRMCYIRLDSRRVLRGDLSLHGGIRPGDHVEATFLPHSKVLVTCERVERRAADAAVQTGKGGDSSRSAGRVRR